MFYRLDENNNAVIFEDCGEQATRIRRETTTYPIGCGLSCAHEHPTGLVLTTEYTERLIIKPE
jgi:hypothetical protein